VVVLLVFDSWAVRDSAKPRMIGTQRFTIPG